MAANKKGAPQECPDIVPGMAFFAHPSPEATVKPRFASAALGGRCNGHDSALMIPVPRVASDLSARQDQAGARPADLAKSGFLGPAEPWPTREIDRDQNLPV